MPNRINLYQTLSKSLKDWGLTVNSETQLNMKLVQSQFHEAIESRRVHDDQMLLNEDCTDAVHMFIVEGSTNGPVKFRGKFQEANAQNKNKREYPFDVLDKNVQRLIETVKARGLIGELDHPTDSIIHFEKASHVITDLWWEGNVLMGEGEILPTPHGKILENLIKSGIRVGISSRGVGNGAVRPNDGVLVIGESFKLITFDAVADPSTFSAYQKMVNANSNKRESIKPEPVMQNIPSDVVNSDIKNEANGINKITNTNAFVAYVGQVITGHVNKLRKETL